MPFKSPCPPLVKCVMLFSLKPGKYTYQSVRSSYRGSVSYVQAFSRESHLRMQRFFLEQIPGFSTEIFNICYYLLFLYFSKETKMGLPS